MEDAMKYFSKKILGHKIFRSMVSWDTNLKKENVKLSNPPPTYLIYAPEKESFNIRVFVTESNDSSP